RLDSASLKAFVSSTGGRYRNARIDDLDLRGLRLFDNPRSLREDGQALQLDSWADQGYWLLLPLLLLAACAGRRGWLFCLPLLLALPQPVYAFEFNDLWLRPDQQGQRLLEQQRPEQAAEHFQHRQWKGVALYQAGDYDGAARLFAQGSSAADHYNRGNALARSGELEAAIDAYEQALELQPELQVALANKALVEQVLQQRQAEQAEQPPKDDPKSDSNAQTDANSSAQSAEGETREQSAQQPSDANKDENASSEQAQQLAGNGDDEETTRPPQRPQGSTLDAEQRQALEQWLRQIPDNPAELLRRKFWYEQQQHQEPHR
ncbi:MAG: tetratricopeptide repeat protein, partial [Pseudomonas sp.]